MQTPPSPSTRVLLVDDHPLVRRGIRELVIEDHPEAEIEEAGDGRTALLAARRKHFDLVILDVSMPGRDGLSVLADLLVLDRPPAVLIVSAHEENLYAVRALRGGAAGYITKSTPELQLRQAIARVLAGGRYVSAEIAELLVAQLGKGAERLPHERLSDRELQVLRLLARGKPVKEIAASLSLSTKTISTYRARVLEKLAVRTTADLVRYAIEAHLV